MRGLFRAVAGRVPALAKRVVDRPYQHRRLGQQDLRKCLGVKSFLEVKLKEHTQLIPRRTKRVRPRARDPVRRVRRRTWTLQILRDSKALTREKRTDGVFPLPTDLKTHSKREVLLRTKCQPTVGKRYSGQKAELEIAPVYLKTPRRVAALVHASFFALVAGRLIEREGRRAMSRHGIGSEIQSPLALVIVGGMRSAVALTLFVPPAVYEGLEPRFPAEVTVPEGLVDRPGTPRTGAGPRASRAPPGPAGSSPDPDRAGRPRSPAPGS